MNNSWLKKISWFVVIFLLILLFVLNKNRTYEAQTSIIFLPKNETTSLSIETVVNNFEQILTSLAFNDRISEGNDALEAGIELPNYKRKEFWNAKLSVERMEKSGVISIANFDKDGMLARELNEDTVENLLAIAGNYYNIQTDLEIRIIDGPIVRKIGSRNLFLTIEQSLAGSLGVYFLFFFFFPFIFVKKEKRKPQFFGQGFSPKAGNLEKIFPVIASEEENYFASKDFLFKAEKNEPKEAKETLIKKENVSLPNFPSFGKKAPTPANLPVSEETVPDIFRQKSVDEKELNTPTEENEATKEKYTPHEATPEEVKERLNKLLRGGMR